MTNICSMIIKTPTTSKNDKKRIFVFKLAWFLENCTS